VEETCSLGNECCCETGKEYECSLENRDREWSPGGMGVAAKKRVA
jgi:hypothetical protein